MGVRRKARELSLQTLYALDFVETDPYLGTLELINFYKDKLVDICEDEEVDLDGKVFKFADFLLESTLKNIDSIDKQISSHSDNWKFDRIAVLDKNIMRIATNEIMFTELAPPIAINEAIEISKKFCSDKSGKFINGILNTIAVEIEESDGK